MRCNLQQWLRLAIFAVGLGVRQVPELALADLVHTPALLVLSILKVLLVLLKASSACLGAVKVCPYASEGVRSSKNQEDLCTISVTLLFQHGAIGTHVKFEVVEQNW